jgi:CTP synthase
MFAEKGMQVTGTSPDATLVEVVEIPDHPWFVAVQYHPEFRSQPTKSHPLFHGFIRAAVTKRSERPERTSKKEEETA